jgi:hypothetical protein
MIDAACGHDPEPNPVKLTDEQKAACSNMGTAVVNDLRFYYPDVVKTRPSTWPLHLRNTIANKAEAMLREILENARSDAPGANE